MTLGITPPKSGKPKSPVRRGGSFGGGTPFLEHIPLWPKAVQALQSGRWVMFSISRYCGGHEILQRLRDRFQSSSDTRVVYLNLKELSVGDAIDYSGLWKSIRLALLVKSGARIVDRPSCEAALDFAIRKEPVSKVMVFLDNPGRGYEKYVIELLALFHGLAVASQDRNGTTIQLCVCDDFSCWYSERYLERPDRSEFFLLRRFIAPALTQGQINLCLNALAKPLAKKLREQIARKIFGLTGGHIGLVRELVEDISARKGHLPTDYFEYEAPHLLSNGAVLEGLRRDIQDDPIGLSNTAMEFVQPNFANEYTSLRYRTLRELGILSWHSEAQLVLCPGTIARFVREIAQIKPKRRIGTIVGLSGTKLFESDEVSLTASDLVVVHISDLHIGAKHGFRIQIGTRLHNESAEPLSVLIARDLDSLGLVGRVDALVVSGDVVCTGQHSEFLRSEEIIRDILERCSIDPERLVIVPGNHDINWSPGEFSGRQPDASAVSSEEYLQFAKLMGASFDKGFLLKVIQTRDQARAVRFLGLDSNFVEGPQASGIGHVSRDVMERATAALKEHDSSRGPIPASTWVVVHHHLVPVTSEPVEKARAKLVSVMSNAPDVLSMVSTWNAEIVLHGHQHQPIVARMERWLGETRRPEFFPFTVVGAGSCGARRELLGPMAQNQYYVLLRRQDTIVIRSRVMGPEGNGFVTNNDLVVGLPGR